jgi:hypothetical protein
MSWARALSPRNNFTCALSCCSKRCALLNNRYAGLIPAQPNNSLLLALRQRGWQSQ